MATDKDVEFRYDIEWGPLGDAVMYNTVDDIEWGPLGDAVMYNTVDDAVAIYAGAPLTLEAVRRATQAIRDNYDPVGMIVPPCPDCGKHGFICDCPTPLAVEKPETSTFSSKVYTGEMDQLIKNSLANVETALVPRCYLCLKKMLLAEQIISGRKLRGDVPCCDQCYRRYASPVAGDEE